MAQAGSREDLTAAVRRSRLPDPGRGRSREDVLDESERRATAGRALEGVMDRARRRGVVSADQAERQAYEELAAARADRAHAGRGAKAATGAGATSSPTAEVSPGAAER